MEGEEGRKRGRGEGAGARCAKNAAGKTARHIKEVSGGGDGVEAYFRHWGGVLELKKIL